MRRDDIRRLHEQRAHAHSEMTKLAEIAEKEDRDLTAEEQGNFDKMCTDFEELRSRAERAEKIFAQEREVEKSLTTPIEKRLGEDDDVPESYKEYQETRHGRVAADLAEYRSAFWRYISVPALAELDVEEQRSLNKGTTTAGGFAVPTAFQNELITISRFTGSMAQLAREMVTDSGETIQLPGIGAHGTASWLAEQATYSPSDETFTQLSLSAFKATAKIIVSEELLQDSAFDLQAYLAEEFGQRLGVLENTAFIKGDGSGKPTGVVAAAGTSSNLVSDATAATGNSTSFNYTALVTGIFTLGKQYRDNASWIVADGTARGFYLMLDGQSRPLWSVNVAVDGPDTFLGYPIYSDPDMPTNAAGNVSAVFGDWKRAYRVRRVQGVGIQRQSELHSDQGQVGFRAFERVDGKVVLSAAGVGLKHSAT